MDEQRRWTVHHERLNLFEMAEHPDLTPAKDESWIERAEAALIGTLPVYWAMVPIGNLIPFDQDYRPDQHSAGMAAIKFKFAEAKEGKFHYPVVYQRGFWFVVSDDYIPLFSALHGMPDYVACFIMGEPDHPLIKDIEPVRIEDVRKILFGADRPIERSN